MHTIDPRLEAARLTEAEFLGDLSVNGPQEAAEALEMFDQTIQDWRSWRSEELLDHRPGYRLHYAPSTVPPYRQVFLAFGEELVGIYDGHFLTVAEDHRGKGLAAELILAGFAHVPWKDQQRIVTSGGAASFKSAYKLAVRMSFQP